MKVGIITYYKVPNFGANLQAVSTYLHLKSNGHNPVFISYIPKEGLKVIEQGKEDPQWKAHLDFVNSIITVQTPICQTADEVLKVVHDYSLDGIIVGSDALLQHHPYITRIRKGRRKPFFIMPVTSDRLFPNFCWGVGISDKVPMALMSVSSQNSEYNLFLSSTKRKMGKALSHFRYISVRDTWTQDMLRVITKKDFSVTPDPVFAFNQNANSIIPSKDDILKRFGLPTKYALMSLFSQVLPEDTISGLKRLLNGEGISLVVLPLPTGVNFKHNADAEVKRPLSPIDWYALLKYSQAYIGSNMHPIVTCLHNAVPCFSIDNWGCVDFWGRKKNDGSSKVEHIMSAFGVSTNHRLITKSYCNVSAKEIFDGIKSFPREMVSQIASEYVKRYNGMMKDIINSIRQV
jgi:hypothetical protein